MKIRDVMTAEVVTVTSDTPYKELVQRLVESDVSGLPVVDRTGLLVGIVTEADLVSKEAYGRRRRALAVLADLLSAREHHWVTKGGGSYAADVMSTDLVTCTPDEDVRVVVRRMLARGVKRAPVVRDGALVGIVSRQDVLRTIARTDDAIAADVTEVLSSHPNRPDDIHVRSSVSDGIVTLNGNVRYAWDIPIVASIVREVAGVIDVVDELHNREPNPEPVQPWMYGAR